MFSLYAVTAEGNYELQMIAPMPVIARYLSLKDAAIKRALYELADEPEKDCKMHVWRGDLKGAYVLANYRQDA